MALTDDDEGQQAVGGTRDGSIVAIPISGCSSSSSSRSSTSSRSRSRAAPAPSPPYRPVLDPATPAFRASSPSSAQLTKYGELSTLFSDPTLSRPISPSLKIALISTILILIEIALSDRALWHGAGACSRVAVAALRHDGHHCRSGPRFPDLASWCC